MNIDACNALHESTLMLSGGKYFYDFYETTPPMFFYLDFPIVALLKYFPSLYFFSVYFFYLLFLSLLSVTLSNLLLNRIYALDQRNIKIIITLAITALFLLEPPYYFGQREYVALVLSMPYFFLLAAQLQSQKINRGLCITVAVIASIGFSIKPQFALAFIFGELYVCVVHKSFHKLFRMESMIIYTIFVIYLISTYLLYPAYFHIIIPLTSEFYYEGINAPFWTLLTQNYIVYVGLSALFYVITFRKHAKKFAHSMIFIAMIGFFLSYLSQLVPWQYHGFTALGFGILLNVLSLHRLYEQKNTTVFKRAAYIFIALLFFKFDSSNILHIPGIPLLYKIIVLSASILFILICAINVFFQKKYILTISIISFSIVIFLFPIINNIQAYNTAVITKITEKPIVDFIKKYAYKKSVYFFESILNYEYPPADYGGAKHVGRFCYLLWLPAYIKEAQEHPNSKRTQQLYQINEYFTKLMANDISVKKPDFIFVDASSDKQMPVFSVHGLDYLSLFLKTPEFASVWKKYHYFATINAEPFYKLDVYQLNNTK